MSQNMKRLEEQVQSFQKHCRTLLSGIEDEDRSMRLRRTLKAQQQLDVEELKSLRVASARLLADYKLETSFQLPGDIKKYEALLRQHTSEFNKLKIEIDDQLRYHALRLSQDAEARAAESRRAESSELAVASTRTETYVVTINVPLQDTWEDLRFFRAFPELLGYRSDASSGEFDQPGSFRSYQTEQGERIQTLLDFSDEERRLTLELTGDRVTITIGASLVDPSHTMIFAAATFLELPGHSVAAEKEQQYMLILNGLKNMFESDAVLRAQEAARLKEAKKAQQEEQYIYQPEFGLPQCQSCKLHYASWECLDHKLFLCVWCNLKTHADAFGYKNHRRRFLRWKNTDQRQERVVHFTCAPDPVPHPPAGNVTRVPAEPQPLVSVERPVWGQRGPTPAISFITPQHFEQKQVSQGTEAPFAFAEPTAGHPGDAYTFEGISKPVLSPRAAATAGGSRKLGRWIPRAPDKDNPSPYWYNVATGESRLSLDPLDCELVSENN